MNDKRLDLTTKTTVKCILLVWNKIGWHHFLLRVCKSTAHPLAGELAKDGGNVAGVLGHDFTDIFLHAVRNAARHACHDLLELQQRQRRVPQSLHQSVHPLFELQPQASAI